MLTIWGNALDRQQVLQEYPRPQLRRDSYLNLNGVWDYAITPEQEAPVRYDGEILVPFSPESELSGVCRTLQPDQFLWYHRVVSLPAGFRRDRLLLHFGAVDQTATVYVNGQPLFTHVGGYTPFCVDITGAVEGSDFELTVRVTDRTDTGEATCGKQRLKPKGTFCPPQSGIWQTVWMESVPENYIRGLRIIPHYDEQKVELWVAGEGICRAEFGGECFDFPAGEPAMLDVPELHPWSPEDPYLYDLFLRLGEDEAESYFAMRKFSCTADENGDLRLCLNGKPYFQNGVQDQGYWSDGLLTAPSDEALVNDITLAKSMGFNLLHKHMKIEPLRWYYHCDRLGMLVWQDMPAGGSTYDPLVTVLPGWIGLQLKDANHTLFARKSAETRAQYCRELREMINALYNCPCIAMWVPFYEGWGQFNAAEICGQILRLDTTRMIDHASGWHDQGIGFIRSRHVFSRTFRMRYAPTDRALILSRFGGYVHQVGGHGAAGKPCGGKQFDSANSYKFALRDLYKSQILPAYHTGLSAAVYAQLSDTFSEENGLVTADRKVVKLSPDLMRGITRMK